MIKIEKNRIEIDKKLKMKEEELGENVIIYKNIELITIFFDEKNQIKIKNYNTVLYDKYLKNEISCENIKQYIKDFMEKIEEELKGLEELEELEEEGDYSNNGYIVREILQGIGFKTLMESLEGYTFIIPKNQRNYIWTKEQVENLAISLIRGFPIPPLYAYRNNKNQLVVLDGQQRLISLFLYYKSKYLRTTTRTPWDLREVLSEDIDPKINFLEELDNKFGVRDTAYFFKENKTNEEEKRKEITYKNLTTEEKRSIDFRTINIIEILIQGEKTVDRENIYYKIFGNLNQGGTQLKNQELRNGIYQCKFYDMIHSINDTSKKWRDIFGTKHKHSRDVELLLRFIATEYVFRFEEEQFNLEEYKLENGKNSLGYQNSYPKLLNNFSKIAMNFSDDEIEEYRIKINIFIEKIKKNKTVPKLLLESLYITSLYVPGEYEIEEAFIQKIEKDPKYQEVIEASSSSKKNVKSRLEYVYAMIKNEYGEENV